MLSLGKARQYIHTAKTYGLSVSDITQNLRNEGWPVWLIKILLFQVRLAKKKSRPILLKIIPSTKLLWFMSILIFGSLFSMWYWYEVSHKLENELSAWLNKSTFQAELNLSFIDPGLDIKKTYLNIFGQLNADIQNKVAQINAQVTTNNSPDLFATIHLTQIGQETRLLSQTWSPEAREIFKNTIFDNLENQTLSIPDSIILKPLNVISRINSSPFEFSFASLSQTSRGWALIFTINSVNGSWEIPKVSPVNFTVALHPFTFKLLYLEASYSVGSLKEVKTQLIHEGLFMAVESEDAKRLQDILSISKALEAYYNKYGGYPLAEIGQALIPQFIWPSSPPAQNACSEYYNTYWYDSRGVTRTGKRDNLIVSDDFTLTFCLAGNIGEYSPGVKQLTPQGIKDYFCESEVYCRISRPTLYERLGQKEFWETITSLDNLRVRLIPVNIE